MKKSVTMGALIGKVRDFDVFAKGVSLSVGKGKQSHGTLLGAFLTLCIWVSLLIFGRFKFNRMMEYEDTTYA